MTEREKYWLWLCSVAEIGVASIGKLIELFGDIEAVFRCKNEEIEKLSWLDGGQKAGLLACKSASGLEKLDKGLKAAGVHFISCENKAYPQRLKHIFEYPKGLFYIGKPTWEEAGFVDSRESKENRGSNAGRGHEQSREGKESKAGKESGESRECKTDGEQKAGRAGGLPQKKIVLAVVGARQSTPLGRLEAERFAVQLSKCGIHIISGMAAGIDAAAHRGALRGGGTTTAVLGCGADICYPAKNSRLYGEICERGCIVSEYPPASPPLAWHFPRRNRILSGMADGVLVVEARHKSGSLITAGFALEQGRDIFAVPGRGCDILSCGCNNLIRQGAFLADRPEDILDYYNIPYAEIKKNKIRLAKTENMVYSTMCLTPKYIEEICAETVLPVSDVISALCRLEKAGLVMRLGAQQYMVKQTHAAVVVVDEKDDC